MLLLQFEQFEILLRYLKHDQRKILPDRSVTYLTDLGMHFEILAVSKIRERECIYKVNHRMAVSMNEAVPWLLWIPRLVNRNWPANPNPSDLGFKTTSDWLARIRDKVGVERMLTKFFYLVFVESRIEIPSNMQSMKRHPSNNSYHRTFSAYFTKAVFRTSRFCLKVTATEISSNLRKSFVNMFLNSHFTKSTEGEI